MYEAADTNLLRHCDANCVLRGTWGGRLSRWRGDAALAPRPALAPVADAVMHVLRSPSHLRLPSFNNIQQHAPLTAFLSRLSFLPL